VRFNRRFQVAKTDLWAAITEPERMARWAFRAEFEPRTGGAMRFYLGEAGVTEGRTVEWDEPSVLEYEWATDTNMPWRIRFELTDEGENATVLTLDHLLPDASNPEFAAGWHWHLDRLATHLAGGRPADVDTDEHFDALLVHYRSELDTCP